MPSRALSCDELLTTTRAVRRRLDFTRGVDLSLIDECISVAIQAPSGSNVQPWHFVVVTDQGRKEAIADIYRQAFERYRTWPTAAGNLMFDDDRRDQAQQRVMDSAEYLATNMHRVPVLVVPCLQGRFDRADNFVACSMLGSVLPAVWNFCLAARARELGTSWTTLHLLFEEEVAAVLGIPFAEITQVALLTVGHTTGGDFLPAHRGPVQDVLHINGW